MRKIHEMTDPTSCMRRADDNEMTFVLLGRDDAAPYAIRQWASERIRLNKNAATDPQIVNALGDAALMERERPKRTRPQGTVSKAALADDDIQEVFRKIAARERVHGDFLTCFAEAYTRADFANKPLLRDAALELIEKYKLAGYATEPAIRRIDK